MCGIAGWIKLKKDAGAHHSEAVLHGMCERMVHRGPDSEGLWVDDTVALGMRRLSIIDLSTGEQPVYNEDRSVVVVMNGELYNFKEIKEDLKRKGHSFETQTDTEILPHLYEEYGEAMVDHLNGMFAFALWDRTRKKLIVARDRFGEKPLYYGVFDGRLIFGSELKVLLANPSVRTETDLYSLRQYLSFDYIPAPGSIYKNISKLPAAHMMIVENGESRVTRYWDLSWKKDSKHSGISRSAEELRDLLSDAVRMRLVSDVPLGILLSGGIDSSTVAALATRYADGKVKTFSIGFEEDSFDESKYARLVAKHLGTEHYEDRLSVDKAADLISEIGGWLDEPLSDGSLIPTLLLSRFVRKHVTVALGGDGGDEIFAGYPMYPAHRIARIYEQIPRFIRSGLIEPVVRSLPVSTNNLSFDYKAKRFIRASKYDLVARHHSWFGSFSIEEQQQLLTRDVLERSPEDIYDPVRRMLVLCDAKDDVEKMQYVDINYYMAEDILTKVDRASMAVSLEVRAPFLDQRVAEFAARIPMDFKLKGSKGKYILKKAVEPLLPSEILNRPKKGFGIPIADWLKGRLNPLMHDLLSPKKVREQGLFNREFVSKMIRDHESGTASYHKQLWTLLVFQLWNEKFGSK